MKRWKIFFLGIWALATLDTIGRFLTGPHSSTPAVIVTNVVVVTLSLLAAFFLLAAQWPVLWSLGATLNAIFVLIMKFATMYLDSGSQKNWSIHLSRTDALLVSLGTFTTAGTSGIAPGSEFARRLVSTQLAVDILAAIVLFGLLAARIADPDADWRFPQLAGSHTSTSDESA